jgi:hypothetical protein
MPIAEFSTSLAVTYAESQPVLCVMPAEQWAQEDRGCHCHEVPFVVFPAQQPVSLHVETVIARSFPVLKPISAIFPGHCEVFAHRQHAENY